MGTQAPSIFLAFAAGLVSFLSPYVLPLVPGYLSTVTGLSPSELSASSGAQLRMVLLRAGLFILTFSVIFIVLGMSATGLGSALADNRDTLTTVAGFAIIATGALFILALFIPLLNRDWHPDVLMRRLGSGGPLLAGAAFAIAWTPCVGPALSSILALAATQGRVATGGGLLAAYSAGLAVPFLLTAVTFSRTATAFGWIKRHYSVINAVSGALLITFLPLAWPLRSASMCMWTVPNGLPATFNVRVPAIRTFREMLPLLPSQRSVQLRPTLRLAAGGPGLPEQT